MGFIDDDFLLQSDAARELYHQFAKPQPIFDFHNHLPPNEIADNRNFTNLSEIWLGGDHYKWRAMRAVGIKEELITGSAPPYEKFLAWARTAPKTLRNPLYHWTHLELRQHFGIDVLLNEESAQEIWDEANRQLATAEFSTQGLLAKFNVVAMCTTDDPVDTLEHHVKMREQGLRVCPAFRPDLALTVDQPEMFNEWIDRLGSLFGIEIVTFDEFLEALDRRHQSFHELGARVSDHGLTRCPTAYATQAEAAAVFDKARSGIGAPLQQQDAFAGFMMVFFGRLDAKRGWTKQLHLGAMRNVRSKGYREIGSNVGFDTIGDYRQGEALAGYLDQLDRTGELPQMVIYNNNPADNYLFSALIGCFQEAGKPGKIQFGSGWWFLDSKVGIEWQLNALSNNGLLSQFIGMLTDSRSFMSFPRHEYFRRVLCNLLGSEIERGELPRDLDLIGGLVEDISFRNAERYFRLGA